MNNQLRGILIGMGFSVLIAAAGAYFVARRITRPIDNLTTIAEKVTASDLNQVAAIERRDQIGTLAASFNTMTGRLRDLIDSLETRVEMRTAQAQALDDAGMVIDFRLLKEKTRALLEGLDHRYLNELPFFQGKNPSAENIAFHLFHELAREINQKSRQVSWVGVWESDTSRAIFRGSKAE